MRWVGAIIRFVRAPRTALAVLGFQAAYSVAAIWVEALTFSSPLFIASVCLLFLSTFVCTVERTRLNLALTRGNVRGMGMVLPRRERVDVGAFLRTQGFRGSGLTLFRNRGALWGGWLLHAGILVLLLGILVQRSLHDSGAFDLSEGEATTLSDSGVVIGRQAGPFAPVTPPPSTVALAAFDPFYHQTGYAPDRASRILIDGREFFVDRAKGVARNGITIFQAIPTSLSVVLDIPGVGPRSLHLMREGDRIAAADLKDLRDDCLRIVAVTERAIDDVQGTGRVELFIERKGHRTPLQLGAPFGFGGTDARISATRRWARFTYSRSSGIPMVFGGFLLILAGSALLVIPCGVACLTDDDEVAARVFLKRGGDALLSKWESWRPLAELNSRENVILSSCVRTVD